MHIPTTETDLLVPNSLGSIPSPQFSKDNARLLIWLDCSAGAWAASDGLLDRQMRRSDHLEGWQSSPHEQLTEKGTSFASPFAVKKKFTTAAQMINWQTLI